MKAKRQAASRLRQEGPPGPGGSAAASQKQPENKSKTEKKRIEKAPAAPQGIANRQLTGKTFDLKFM